MQPGWYAHIQEPKAVAYFDGTSWGPLTDRFSLPLDIQVTIAQLHPKHPGPRAPFETITVTGSRKSKPGSGWFWGIGAGAFLVFWGIMIGFGDAGANCGAPFRRSGVAELMDAMAQDSGLGRTTYAAGCRESIASATVWVWVLILIGVLLMLGSSIIMAVLRSGQASRAATPVARPMPTVASQIEELARLRDKGLVTPEEFEWKKQDLLRRS